MSRRISVQRLAGVVSADGTERGTVHSEALLLGAYGGTPSNPEVLQRLVNLREVVDEAIGVVVARQRPQGAPLADLAPITKCTEDQLGKSTIRSPSTAP